MIEKLLWLSTDNTYPYKNLATEEYLTMNVKPGECIMYLWQNRHTVVIGKNQNCWKECKVNSLEEDGGYLVRRLSGGGAVFHDMGNLNFTFMVRHSDYNVEKQQAVILRAVQLLGIHGERTGRNDITVDGRKFSGNAFLRVGDQCYHHGTIMISANTEDMSRYLNVDKKKLESKGVESVKSRVANLNEFRSDITVSMMRDALIEAFEETYGLKASELSEGSLPQAEIHRLTEKFESWQWKYGPRIPFDYEIADRFQWGDVQMQLHVDGGKIEEINFYSDAMDQEVITRFRDSLVNRPYSEKDMVDAIMNVKMPQDGTPDDIVAAMRSDISELIKRKL